MKIAGKSYSRSEILQRAGSISQLGGTRRYTLADGRAKGVSAIDFDTGSGLKFTVLPGRGMDISLASFRGTNLVYLTPNGEAHPAFYEPSGLGWLRTFFAGLLTTCGLTHLGSPGTDGEEELGLHGRHSATPAARVCDLSRWEDDEYVLEVSGVIEDAVLFGDKIRLTRTISARMGSKSLVIRDVAENFGYASSPFTILYHINPGFPLLDASSELALCSKQTTAYEEWADTSSMCKFDSPLINCREENFHHVMASDEAGFAYCAMINRELCGGLGLYARFGADTLPYLNEWKMLGQGEYVVGMEPCNVPCQNRAVLREKGTLTFLEPGESREMIVEIGVLDGPEEIDVFVRRVEVML
ncbi:MAG: aldose 1-epimerase family protein [Armatimonadota bacterium]